MSERNTRACCTSCPHLKAGYYLDEKQRPAGGIGCVKVGHAYLEKVNDGLTEWGNYVCRDHPEYYLPEG